VRHDDEDTVGLLDDGLGQTAELDLSGHSVREMLNVIASTHVAMGLVIQDLQVILKRHQRLLAEVRTRLGQEGAVGPSSRRVSVPVTVPTGASSVPATRGRRPKRPYSPSEIAAIRQMAKMGTPKPEIADKFGRNTTMIYRIVKYRHPFEE
jgi:hypothetical protein